MLKLNDKVKFERFSAEYTVHACNERYAICVDETSKQKYYSIIDFKENIRGTHNSYSHSTTSKESCEEVLAGLCDEQSDLNISHRNRVDLDIELVNGKPFKQGE